MSLRDDALEMHKRNQGKFDVTPKVKVTNKEELSLAYSPGVADHVKRFMRIPVKSMIIHLKAIL